MNQEFQKLSLHKIVSSFYSSSKQDQFNVVVFPMPTEEGLIQSCYGAVKPKMTVISGQQYGTSILTNF